MDTNVDDEKELPSDESVMQAIGDVEPVSDIVEPIAGGASADLNPVENEVLTTIDLHASKDGYWATLRGSYSWSADGSTFTWYSSHYQARDNDRDEGNIEQSLYQDPRNGSTGWYRETTGAAVQNGQWQPHRAGETIPVATNRVRIGFGYTYDRKGVGDVYMDNAVYLNYKPATPAIDPIKNFNASTFNVTGGGGVSGATIVLDSGGGTIGMGPVQNNGRWSAQVTVANNVNSQTIQAYQQVRGTNSDRTGYITVHRATLTSPAPNATVPQKDLMFKGRGAPNTVMSVHNPADSWDQWAESVTVGDTGSWETRMTKVLPSGPVTVHARHTYPGIPYGWTQPVSFTLLGFPALKGPGAGSLQEQIFPISGDNALNGAIVVGYVTGTQTEIGRGNANPQGGFTFDTKNLSPGPVSIELEQFHSQKQSGRGASRLFLIRPSMPTFASRPKGTGIELYGTGYNGATVHIHRSGDAVNVLLEATVSDGLWKKEIPADWLPGNYNLSARQSVSDGGIGRIYSAGWVAISTNVPTPALTGVSATVNGQKPTFTGNGNQWGTTNGTCVIFNGNTDMRPSVPAGTVGAGGRWTATAISDLPPGNYPNLTARQWVNNQWSADSAKISLNIASPPPNIINPPVGVPTGQRPRISGTAWPGSAIIITIPGIGTFPVTATGGSFELNPIADWPPGTYTITVTATFGGSPDSVPSTRPVTVKTPVPNIDAAEEVDLKPVITGKGWPDCWIEIYDGATNLPLGAGPVGPDGVWRVMLTEHNPGELIVYARQKERQDSSNISDKTANRTVKVRVPKALITVPPQNGKAARKSTFSGTTSARQGTVELKVKGESQPLVKDIELKEDGSWEATVELPQVGPKTIEARLWQNTYSSEPEERVITVMPNVPVVDTPHPGEALGALLRISGFGVPKDDIRIDRRGRFAYLTTVPVTSEGTWSARVAHGMVEGDGITAVALASGLPSEYSNFERYKLLTPAPKMTEPLAGDWVGVNPRYSGLAAPGATVMVASWLNPEDRVAPQTQANDEGHWSVVGNKDLPVGPARVMVSQIQDGKISEWSENVRFMVERLAGVEAPSVDCPFEGQEVGRQQMYSGTGEPGADILIVNANDKSMVLATTRVERDGKWAARTWILLPVDPAPFTFCVRQSRDGVESDWSPERTFKVIQFAAGFPAPIIQQPVNDATQALEPRPLIAGRDGAPGAELNVYLHGTTNLLARTRVDAQGNWSVRCAVDLVLQADAHQITAQQNMDGQLSALSDTVSFKVADIVTPPVITDPLNNAYVSPKTVFRGTTLPGAEVLLHKAGDAGTVWGRGVADQNGEWVIVPKDLPLGEFHIGGKAVKGTVHSAWGRNIALNVIDLG